ncbi:MAG: ribose 5-phosphate isomerase B [Phycisphaeraceae bacterium]|nr:ribose 5-phosphate isomerase B [Phycisphaeraceae bacterium]
MKIALGADHRGSEFLRRLRDNLENEGHEITLHGSVDGQTADYPVAAFEVALAIHHGRAERGVLICGSGIGMCIAANKVPGVRAALVHDEFEAQMSRRHNDANVICLSAHTLGRQNIDRLIQSWLQAEFEGGRHARRVAKIQQFEAACSVAMAEGKPLTMDLPASSGEPNAVAGDAEAGAERRGQPSASR